MFTLKAPAPGEGIGKGAPESRVGVRDDERYFEERRGTTVRGKHFNQRSGSHRNTKEITSTR